MMDIKGPEIPQADVGRAHRTQAGRDLRFHGQARRRPENAEEVGSVDVTTALFGTTSRSEHPCWWTRLIGSRCWRNTTPISGAACSPRFAHFGGTSTCRRARNLPSVHGKDKADTIVGIEGAWISSPCPSCGKLGRRDSRGIFEGE